MHCTMNTSIDYLPVIFFSMLTNAPYEPLAEAYEIAMKTPAVAKLSEQIRANRDGVYTPIKEKTVDDAIDAIYMITEKYNEEMLAGNPIILTKEKERSKDSGNIVKIAIKKKLIAEGLLKK